MIRIYDVDEKIFGNNGIKILKPLKCYIFKEDNGDYYIEIDDSINNEKYYQSNMIITCPTPFPEGTQAFRICDVRKSNSKVSIKARHVYFDSANYIILDNYIVDKDCNYALDHLNSNTDNISPFTTSSNILTVNSYRCIRKTLEEAIETIIERWGGHLVRNNFNISINSNIGEDRGITLKYAKNIISAKSTENWDNVCTKILPVGKDGILLPEIYIEASQPLYEIPYTKVVSFNQDIEQLENETNEEYELRLITDLRNQAVSFLNENQYPKVNYTISAHLDNITDVGDTIYVEHPRLNMHLTTNVISVKYDAISKRYISIEFGNFKNSLKSLINNIGKQTEEIAQNISQETHAFLENELKQATAQIWSTLGNSYVIYEGDKILVVDTLPKEDATNVMMINSAGIGFSNTGINGTFTSAWTTDGTLNMQNVNVINLVADMIKGGTLKLGGENNVNGTLEIYDEYGNRVGKIDNTGLTVSDANSPIATMVNYAGLEVDRTSDNSELLYAGIDEDSSSLTYGSSIVRTNNLTVKTYLQCANGKGRIEEYTDDNNHTGVGFFLT